MQSKYVKELITLLKYENDYDYPKDVFNWTEKHGNRIYLFRKKKFRPKWMYINRK